jgi:hypothetical protein
VEQCGDGEALIDKSRALSPFALEVFAVVFDAVDGESRSD